jgi:MerR family transcriptional regulator, redox-sensitive transcriptional activator SoxR
MIEASADDTLSIGEVATRSGLAASALRYYERQGLISASRTSGGTRRFDREVLRRVAFIRVAQRVGLSLDEIGEALATLPDGRTPTVADWNRLSKSWKSRIAAQMELLERLNADLSSCIGCGCLSLKACRLYNPNDAAAALGDGPRYLLGDRSTDVLG